MLPCIQTSTRCRFYPIRICLILILFLSLPTSLSFALEQEGNGIQKSHANENPPKNPNDPNQKKIAPRIAILIPYIGHSLPSYFPLFAHSAAGSSSLIDFFVIHNGIPTHLLPPPDQQKQFPNVKLLNLTGTKRMANFLLKVVEDRNESLEMPYQDLLNVFTQHIERYPYVLVEFKLAMGHIFQNFLTDYTHWGYSDLDIVFGDLPRWITNEELEKFDIVTYGYGDQNRLYLRGQFTFMKNNAQINQIWRECTYLSKIDARFNRAMKGIEKLNFESAEGCFSQVVLSQSNIKVKYAVKAFTDITDVDTVNSHGLYMGTGQNGNRSVLYKAGSNQGDGKQMNEMPLDWFESDGSYAPSKSLQWEVGPKTLIKTHADIDDPNKGEVKCMHWTKARYQKHICALDVDPDDTVFLIDGVLYKQKHITQTFPNNIQSLPLFHFQEWKRYFRHSQINPLLHSKEMGSKGLIVTSNGVLPILPSHAKDNSERSVDNQVNNWAQTKFIEDQLELPTASFCLRSSKRTFPPEPKSSECIEYASWQDEENVLILSSGDTWNSVNSKEDVTFALTLQLNAADLDEDAFEGLIQLAEANIRIWGNEQPSVWLIHLIDAATKEVANQVHQYLMDFVKATQKISVEEPNMILNSDSSKEKENGNPFASCLVAMIVSDDIHIVSRKALLNMATAAAPTRFVVSGLELERGLMISKETSLFAKRAALIHGESSGNVFIIPQYAADNEDSNGRTFSEHRPESLSVEDLLSKKSNLKFSQLKKYDCFPCDDNYYTSSKEESAAETDIENQINSIWREITKFDLSVKRGRMITEEKRYSMSKKAEKLQIDLINLFRKEHEKSLRNYDVNPLLMVDSIGPFDGSITSSLASEVEELGGLRCFNGIRLVQLAVFGYNIQVLPGAFSISFPSTREIARGGDCSAEEEEYGYGLSRCDGCFMYEDMDLLESIIMDERNRTAKTSLLWNELFLNE